MVNLTAADRLVDYLPAFNNKERYHLIRQVLDMANPYAFDFGMLFRTDLEDALGVKLGYQLYNAIDYHLDWIHASIYMAREDVDIKDLTAAALAQRRADHTDISGTQESIDMLAVFAVPDVDLAHLVMIEASSDGVWDEEQLKSKVQRFKTLFAEDNLIADGRPFAQVHFVLISPIEPGRKHDPEVNRFLDEALYLPMTFPRESFYKVTGCDKAGKSQKEAEYWKVFSEKIPGSGKGPK